MAAPSKSKWFIIRPLMDRAAAMSRPPAGFPQSTGPSSGLELTAVLGPVRAQNAFEETVERLLTVIKLGVIAPGDRFPAERELAGLLGVSRITLREAIRALQLAG